MTNFDNDDVFELEMQINDGGMSFDDEDFAAYVVAEACKQMTPWQETIFALHLGCSVELNLIAEMCDVTPQAIGHTWRQALSTVARVSAIGLAEAT